MKKFISLFAILLMFSCDDGDFDVPSFEFDTVSIESCDDLFLYKINESESLSLQLNDTNTTTEFFDETIDNVSYTITNGIVYRLFNDDVDSDYYCQSNPPSSPSITNEWTGSGTVIINNIITTGTPNEFDASITIENMVLTNGSGNEIRYESYDFGTFSGTFN